MSTNKPTFIIVHGAWHRPIHFQLVTTSLSHHGYKTLAPALPSVDKAPGTIMQDSSEDIATVRATILEELDSGNNVIVVPHSYGGIPTSGAIEGLDAESRARQGKETSVLAIAAISSYILPKGMDIPAAEGKPKPTVPDLYGPMPTSVLWHDIPQSSETHKWASEALNSMSMLALYDTCKFTAYDTFPVHFLLCGDDRAMTPPTQESVVGRIEREGKAGIRTERLEGSSHSPFLSRVEETVAFLRRSAGEEV